MQLYCIPILIKIRIILVLSEQNFCENIETEKEFYPLRHCQRSTKRIVAFANVYMVSQCADLAKQLKGLAFNFSPNNRRNKNLFQNSDKPPKGNILDTPEEYYNCHVLECPEYRNYSTIVNDSRFDYYSLYSNPPPPLNATCIPQVGIFQLYMIHPQNYSNAFNICITESNGALSHILSAARTNGISSFLNEIYKSTNEFHSKLAYVGLNFTFGEDDDFTTSEWENLNCFLFRAWAPGQPRENLNLSCVAITTQSSWVTVPCQRELPFICEIYTSIPGRELDLKRKCSTRRGSNHFYVH